VISVTTDALPPGTYWFCVTHADHYCAPCGRWNDYIATLTCETLPPPGNTCTDPIPVTLSASVPFFEDANTTCGRGDDYGDTCLGSYDGGEEIVYELTVLEPMFIDIRLEPDGTNWTGFAIDDTCPPGGSCIASSTCPSGPHTVEFVYLDPGVYYVVVDTWPAPDCIPSFVISIGQPAPRCPVDCPPGATQEGEPCGSDTNGGCSLNPPQFEPLTCGETVCGTLWARCGERDNDWYQVTVTEDTQFTWSVQSEVEVLIGLVETDPPGSGDCWDMLGLNPFATGYCCDEPLSVTTDVLPPGTYWFYVAHADFYLSPCGDWNDYVATLTCESPPAPGDNCGNPITVELDYASLPYTDINTTCGRSNDYQDTCLDFYDGGEDIVYELTFPYIGCYGVSLDPMGTLWTGIAVSNTCPAGADCIDYATADSGAPRDIYIFGPGTFYVTIDTWPPPDCLPQYTLTVYEIACEYVSCPAGGIPENEDCGDDTNGGCGMPVPHFEPINCGDTVCGTAWADGGTRDTDWYAVVLTEPQILTWSATAEFPLVIGLVETDPPGSGDCWDMTGYLNPYDSAGSVPDLASITTDVLTPGTYWLWIAHQEFDNRPCSGSSDYVAELTCEPPPGR
jgi:hypothetical protein